MDKGRDYLRTAHVYPTPQFPAEQEVLLTVLLQLLQLLQTVRHWKLLWGWRRGGLRGLRMLRLQAVLEGSGGRILACSKLQADIRFVEARIHPKSFGSAAHRSAASCPG